MVHKHATIGFVLFAAGYFAGAGSSWAGIIAAGLAISLGVFLHTQGQEQHAEEPDLRRDVAYGWRSQQLLSALRVVLQQHSRSQDKEPAGQEPAAHDSASEARTAGGQGLAAGQHTAWEASTAGGQGQAAAHDSAWDASAVQGGQGKAVHLHLPPGPLDAIQAWRPQQTTGVVQMLSKAQAQDRRQPSQASVPLVLLHALEQHLSSQWQAPQPTSSSSLGPHNPGPHNLGLHSLQPPTAGSAPGSLLPYKGGAGSQQGQSEQAGGSQACKLSLPTQGTCGVPLPAHGMVSLPTQGEVPLPTQGTGVETEHHATSYGTRLLSQDAAAAAGSSNEPGHESACPSPVALLHAFSAGSPAASGQHPISDPSPNPASNQAPSTPGMQPGGPHVAGQQQQQQQQQGTAQPAGLGGSSTSASRYSSLRKRRGQAAPPPHAAEPVLSHVPAAATPTDHERQHGASSGRLHDQQQQQQRQQQPQPLLVPAEQPVPLGGLLNQQQAQADVLQGQQCIQPAGLPGQQHIQSDLLQNQQPGRSASPPSQPQEQSAGPPSQQPEQPPESDWGPQTSTTRALVSVVRTPGACLQLSQSEQPPHKLSFGDEVCSDDEEEPGEWHTTVFAGDGLAGGLAGGMPGWPAVDPVRQVHFCSSTAPLRSVFSDGPSQVHSNGVAGMQQQQPQQQQQAQPQPPAGSVTGDACAPSPLHQPGQAVMASYTWLQSAEDELLRSFTGGIEALPVSGGFGSEMVFTLTDLAGLPGPDPRLAIAAGLPLISSDMVAAFAANKAGPDRKHVTNPASRVSSRPTGRRSGLRHAPQSWEGEQNDTGHSQTPLRPHSPLSHSFHIRETLGNDDKVEPSDAAPPVGDTHPPSNVLQHATRLDDDRPSPGISLVPSLMPARDSSRRSRASSDRPLSPALSKDLPTVPECRTLSSIRTSSVSPPPEVTPSRRSTDTPDRGRSSIGTSSVPASPGHTPTRTSMDAPQSPALSSMAGSTDGSICSELREIARAFSGRRRPDRNRHLFSATDESDDRRQSFRFVTQPDIDWDQTEPDADTPKFQRPRASRPPIVPAATARRGSISASSSSSSLILAPPSLPHSIGIPIGPGMTTGTNDSQASVPGSSSTSGLVEFMSGSGLGSGNGSGGGSPSVGRGISSSRSFGRIHISNLLTLDNAIPEEATFAKGQLIKDAAKSTRSSLHNSSTHVSSTAEFEDLPSELLQLLPKLSAAGNTPGNAVAPPSWTGSSTSGPFPFLDQAVLDNLSVVNHALQPRTSTEPVERDEILRQNATVKSNLSLTSSISETSMAAPVRPAPSRGFNRIGSMSMGRQVEVRQVDNSSSLPGRRDRASGTGVRVRRVSSNMSQITTTVMAPRRVQRNAAANDSVELETEEAVILNRRLLDARKLLLQEVKINEVLGFGSMGIIYYGTLFSMRVVVKLIEHGGGLASKEQQRARMARIEAAVSRLLLHPNIVVTYDCCTGNLDTSRLKGVPKRGSMGSIARSGKGSAGRNHRLMTMMVQEYCDEGTLKDALARDKLKSLVPSDDYPNLIVQLALDIAEGLKYMHSLRILHIDLKAENVLLQRCSNPSKGRMGNLVAKVADFGLATVLSPDVDFSEKGVHGTVSHMPPEAMKDTVFSCATDVWSFGVVLWELVTRDKPFSGMTAHQVVDAICDKGMRLAWPPGLHPTLMQLQLLACECWETGPLQRPSFSDIVDRLANILRPAAGEHGTPGRVNSILTKTETTEESDELEAALRQQRKKQAAASKAIAVAMASNAGRPLSTDTSRTSSASGLAPFMDTMDVIETQGVLEEAQQDAEDEAGDEAVVSSLAELLAAPPPKDELGRMLHQLAQMPPVLSLLQRVELPNGTVRYVSSDTPQTAPALPLFRAASSRRKSRREQFSFGNWP